MVSTKYFHQVASIISWLIDQLNNSYELSNYYQLINYYQLNGLYELGIYY